MPTAPLTDEMSKFSEETSAPKAPTAIFRKTVSLAGFGIEESPEVYAGKGCFHPVQVGDVYNLNGYEVIRKLGAGSHSTIWLADDLRSVPVSTSVKTLVEIGLLR